MSFGGEQTDKFLGHDSQKCGKRDPLIFSKGIAIAITIAFEIFLYEPQGPILSVKQ